jgi:molybdate transport system ATP-binding protein
MSIRASLHAQLGTLTLALDFVTQEGEVLALVGPNGAGKTTTLRTIAGLVPLAAGSLVVDEVVLEDPVRGIYVPPERRSVGLVFQDYLLFPHLTALQNVAFGLQARGLGKRESEKKARHSLARMALADRADQRPSALSGGQAQRVALARALAIEPRILLLDEPLAAIDRKARREIRSELANWLDSFKGYRMLVTHDEDDAEALADRVLTLERGRLVEERRTARRAGLDRA